MKNAKIAVITGANSGIGLATARLLAAEGFNIVALCRRKAEGERVVADLQAAQPSITAENFAVDLSDLPAVKRTAIAISEKYPVIDRLINNAGYWPLTIEYVNGIEKSFVASHLGHMLLTDLLMPSLKNSHEARVINISSALHGNGRAARFFTNPADHNPSKAYGDDKLANVLFTIALSKELPPNVTTYSLHPGVVNTNFANTVTGAMKVLMTLFSIFFITPEKGAATTVYLATVPIDRIRSFNGMYFVKQRPASTRNSDISEINAANLWKKSKEILSGLV